MTTGADRPSRASWPDPDEPLTGGRTGPTHTHRMPAWVRLGMVAMAAVLIALSVAVGALLVYVEQLKAERAHQVAETRAQIRGSFCDLLNLFPSDIDALRVPRQTYHCGPGAPPHPQRPTTPPSQGAHP